MSHPHRSFLLALSGPSSSGKTTVARLLRRIFPSALILHEDDFYKPETELPHRAGMLDWDSVGAIDVPALAGALAHLKTTGALPENLVSKEDGNVTGESGVGEELVQRLKGEVRSWAEAQGMDLGWSEGREVGGNGNGGAAVTTTSRLVIVDGFLLFGKSVPELREIFDEKILLRATFETGKARREARKGYVTLEGFWEDPEGYVDKVVWPGYVEEHAFLFRGGDVDGEVNEDEVARLGIQVCPGGGTWSVGQMLEWVVQRLKESLQQAAAI